MKKKDEPTFMQLLDRHWYQMPHPLRQALRHLCSKPSCQVAKAWAERNILVFAIPPSEDSAGTAARDRMAKAIINNRDLPSVRELVLRRVA